MLRCGSCSCFNASEIVVRVDTMHRAEIFAKVSHIIILFLRRTHIRSSSSFIHFGFRPFDTIVIDVNEGS